MGHYFLRRLIGVGLVFLITFVIFPAILLVLVFVGNGFKLPFKPPPPPLTMEQVLAELKQPDLFRQLNTLDRLKRMKPDANRRTVVEALKPLLDDQNLILRERALVAFGVWGEPEDAAVVVRVMESASGTTRWTAYDTLAMIKGPVAAEALASKLKDFGDRVIVRNALKALGPRRGAVRPALPRRRRLDAARRGVRGAEGRRDKGLRSGAAEGRWGRQPERRRGCPGRSPGRRATLTQTPPPIST